MYSPEVESLLKSKKIRIGDRIRIIKKHVTYEGILMPRIKLGDTSCLVIKLDNGYNVGIRLEKGDKIKLVKRGKPIRFRPSKAAIKKEKGKPNISILGCGGTIASRIEYTTGAVFPAFSPADLLASFPSLKQIANISARKLFDLFSEDMTPEHWKIIAREVEKEVKKGNEGVVLMHGTDTMHYTSAALSFMLRDLPVPVVLVGAQRSSDRGSSDNWLNLTSAVMAACSDIAEVMVCMHGTMNDTFCYLHPGTKVRKLHTSRRDAFQTVNSTPFAQVFPEKGKIIYLREDYRRRGKRKLKVDDKLDPDVCLLYIYPGIKPEFVEKLGEFFHGVVIAGTGLGHVPCNPGGDKFAKSLVPALKSLIDSGIPVVIAPQTIFGRLNMNVYSTGRILQEIGVIGNLCDWLPEVAFVKLMWVLGHTKKMEEVRKLMLTNIAGEISERSVVDEG